jgi:hypothetical protein
VSVPAGAATEVHEADPDFSEAAHKKTEPTLNATVPVGVPEDATVAE